VKRLFSATLNSLRGLAYCLRHEAAVREEAILLAAAIPLGFFVAPNLGWYVGMIGSLLALLAVELLNTAIEKFADYVTRERHVEIRRIKDFGADMACGNWRALWTSVKAEPTLDVRVATVTSRRSGHEATGRSAASESAIANDRCRCRELMVATVRPQLMPSRRKKWRQWSVSTTNPSHASPVNAA
jgi:diacylglycerol kinase (ATP)